MSFHFPNFPIFYTLSEPLLAFIMRSQERRGSPRKAGAFTTYPDSNLLTQPQCNQTICPLSTYNQAWFSYLPSLPGNALYEALFFILLVLQLFLGIRYKTWGFLIGMVSGLILEVTGYIGRLELHFNPFKKSPFLVYLVPLTMGPAFLSAAVYRKFAFFICCCEGQCGNDDCPTMLGTLYDGEMLTCDERSSLPL